MSKNFTNYLKNNVSNEKYEKIINFLKNKLGSEFNSFLEEIECCKKNELQDILLDIEKHIYVIKKEKNKKVLFYKNGEIMEKYLKDMILDGFDAPVYITQELSDFLKLPKNICITRPDITKLIVKYIRDNDIQKKENQSIIIDIHGENGKDLKKLLKIEDDVTLNFFNIQKYINPHILDKALKSFSTIKRVFQNQSLSIFYYDSMYYLVEDDGFLCFHDVFDLLLHVQYSSIIQNVVINFEIELHKIRPFLETDVHKLYFYNEKYFCSEYDKYYYFNNQICNLIDHCFDDIDFNEVEKYISKDCDEYIKEKFLKNWYKVYGH